jgi:CheY-like chemotaxis protein
MTSDRPSVLIVEDDADTLDLIAEVLRDDGYRVASATNGEEALATLRAAPERPSLILLDLLMPVMNGWQFLEARAAEGVFAEIPVLVLSADPARQLAAQRGVVAVISKPFDLGRLLRLVRAVTKAQAAPVTPA